MERGNLVPSCSQEHPPAATERPDRLGDKLAVLEMLNEPVVRAGQRKVKAITRGTCRYGHLEMTVLRTF